jgi:hypothetical protein
VKVQNAPWAAVVAELEHRTGILVRVEGSLTGTLTQAFEDLPLEQGLRRLFRNTNVVFLYRPATTAETAVGSLIHVWLFPRDESRVEQRAELDSARTSAEGARPDGEVVSRDSQAERLSALQAFAEQGNAQALRRAVSDPDPTIQLAAFELLAAQDRRGAIAALRSAAKRDRPEMRLQALQLLHHTHWVDRETALAVLGEALADENVTVKSYVIRALVAEGGPDALSYLGQASRDSDPSVQMLAIESIVQMDHGHILLQEGAIGEEPR